MKKIMSIAVCVAVFGLVGCSNSVQDKSSADSYKDTISQVDAEKGKCKGKKCRHHHKGKLGEEKLEQDTNK